MDFVLTPEQEALRVEFATYFEDKMQEAPPGWIGGIETWYATDENWAFHLDVARELGQKGWLSLPWPKKYGGREHSIVEQLIFKEIVGYYNAPGVDPMGVAQFAPTLLIWGAEEQKEEHLYYIARGERMWCQGSSEPNAGSDLASVTTRAVRQGDKYIVNGQKIWTSGAHRCHWCFALVRTDPAQKRSRGLSFLVIDMKTPGITLRPLWDMAGNYMWNEMFLDDVEVPVANRIGPENEGWAVIRTTSNFERSNIGVFGETRRDLERLVQFCKQTIRDGKPLAQDPLVRHMLSEIALEVDVGYAMARHVAWLQQKGNSAVVESSAAKVWGTELFQRLSYTGCQILGLYSQIKGDSSWAPLLGRFEMLYQTALGWNIGGGTSEIQRNIIAWEGLGLPRV